MIFEISVQALGFSSDAFCIYRKLRSFERHIQAMQHMESMEKKAQRRGRTLFERNIDD